MRTTYLILNFDGPLPPDEVTSAPGYDSPPLGEIATVKAEIERCLPELHWDEKEQRLGYTTNDGYLIEWSLLGEGGHVSAIAAQPYGIALVESALARLCRPNGWYVFDGGGAGYGWIAPEELRLEDPRF